MSLAGQRQTLDRQSNVHCVDSYASGKRESLSEVALQLDTHTVMRGSAYGNGQAVYGCAATDELTPQVLPLKSFP
jgi:hypothetical protein